MRRIIAPYLVTIFLLAPRFAVAQVPVLLSTEPSDGAVDVPLETTVTFVFDRPVEREAVASMIYGINANAFKLTIEDGNRAVFTVNHDPESDVVWIMEGVYPISACEVAPVQPATLHYTTATTIGHLTVSGIVHLPGAPSKAKAGDAVPHPHTPEKQLRRGENASNHPGGTNHVLARSQVASPAHVPAEFAYGAVSALRIDHDGPAWQVERFAGRSVISASGAFEIPYLRAGKYVLRASYDIQVEEGWLTYFGSWDPNGDGIPDTLEVPDSGVDNLEIALRERREFYHLMEDRLEEARAASSRALKESEVEPGSLILTAINAWHVEPDGRGLWSYVFYDPANQRRVTAGFDGFWSGGVLRAYTESVSGAPPSPLSSDHVSAATVVADAFSDPAVQEFVAQGDEVSLGHISAGSPHAGFGLSSLDGQPVWLLRFTGLFPVAGEQSECEDALLAWSYLTLYKDFLTGETRAIVHFPAMGAETAAPYEAAAHQALRDLLGDEEEAILYRLEAAFWLDPPGYALAGESYYWTFEYRTESYGCLRVAAGSGQIMQEACMDPEAPEIVRPFVDSNVAMRAAVDEGADEIVAEFERTSLDIYGGRSFRLGTLHPTYDGRPVWEVTMTATDGPNEGDPAAELFVYIDMATGEPIYTRSRRFGVDTEPPTMLPQSVRLEQNYPNPFNPTTTISFVLPSAAHVSVTVYDVTGRRVDTLVEAWKPGGAHAISWAPEGLPSGVYYLRLRAGEAVRSLRMVLLR